MIGYIV